MAKKHYDIERQGQADFFDNFHIDYQNDNSVLVDNTDGVYSMRSGKPMSFSHGMKGRRIRII